MPNVREFIYFLTLHPSSSDMGTWGERENDIVHRHFTRLKELADSGTVVLAGRTLVEDPTGIVILRAESDDEARLLMESDPAVAEGLMLAKLYPYSIAIGFSKA